MTRTSNEIGTDLEQQVADKLGGSLVPGSGNVRFLKLDVSNRMRWVFSCKASEKVRDTAMRAILKLWKETVRGTRGFTGHGDGARPGMVFEMDGETLVLVRLDDFADLATGEIEPFVPADKAAERRGRSRVSFLT
jgi:hypothetical protein